VGGLVMHNRGGCDWVTIVLEETWGLLIVCSGEWQLPCSAIGVDLDL
jgi:hypothetical protein